ncbi:MAG: phosphoribosylformylglycinamidine cyclo-ligase [Pseudomonadota bacterium]
MSDNPARAYAAAGVNIEAGDALVERIKPLATRTARPGARADLGGFGAVFDLGAAGHTGSLLVASTDGVGTKVRLASELDAHRGIGIDLVAMCVNDILAQGAEPLFFLDYYATHALNVDAAHQVIAGIADGCAQAGCALIGGETAEMPGHYAPGDYDLAGFVVGAVAPGDLLPRAGIASGHVLIALESSGLHANGFSLIRRIAASNGWDFTSSFGAGTLGEALLEPTKIYVRPVLDALRTHGEAIGGIAHITGGGLTGNIPRMLPQALAATLNRSAFPTHPLMEFVKVEGGLVADEMEATFNCGIGLVLAVTATEADAVCATLDASGQAPHVIGAVVARGEALSACQIN